MCNLLTGRMVQIGRCINYVTLTTGLIYSVQITVVRVQMTVTYYSKRCSVTGGQEARPVAWLDS